MTILLGAPTLIGIFLGINVMHVEGSCMIGVDFKDLFLQAVDELEEKIQDGVTEKIDDLGLGPLALSFSQDILDVKEDVLDSLFPPEGREAWFEGVEEFDLEAKLQELNLDGNLIVICEEVDANTWSFDVSFESPLETLTNPLTNSSIAILPEPLPELIFELDDPQIQYRVELPFRISLEGDHVSLGEIKADVAASFGGSITQELPILPDEQGIMFEGTIAAMVSFDYSSFSQLTYEGSYSLDASVDVSNTAVVANLALQAYDDNFFDTKPPIVNFDFDLCDTKQNLMDAISSFTLTKEVLDTLLDDYLDLSDNEILVDEIKNAFDPLVSKAETQVENVKLNILSTIDSIDCQTRRTLRSEHIMEVTGTGDVKRDLLGEETFSFLTDGIRELDSVSSVSAGYFAARNEIAVDVGLAVDEVFDKESFRSALSNVFDNLEGQDLFGADNNTDIDAILDSVAATALFTTELSFGLKVGDIGSILSKTENLTIDGLFLRVDEVSVSAKIAAEGLSQEIFDGISIDDGALDIMAGVELAEPFELTLDINDGSLENEISFAQTVTGRFKFEPVGHLFATLPIGALVNNQEWNLAIIFEDDDLFKPPALEARIDFDACQIVEIFQLLLGKLGELTISMESIVGPSAPFSNNIDIGLDDLENGFDSLLPNLGSYIEGALEAKNEIFHLCAEVNATGADPPSIEDVIALIQEDVFGAQGERPEADARRLHSRRALRNHHLPHTRSSRHQRDRALRAHHLPFNHYTRPRDQRSRHSRRLQDAVGAVDLLDSLTVEGGFDGSMIYVRLSVDVSKSEMDDIADLLEKPLDALSGVEALTNVFGGGGGTSSLSLETDFSAGAHFSVLVGCEITGSELVDITSFNSRQLFEKSFLQFEDASAKFEASASVSGELGVPNLAALQVEGGSVSLAFGIGISEASEKIFFNQTLSGVQALRQKASWNQVGAIDISLPVTFDIDELPSVTPIITISDDNLFDSEAADVSIDCDIRSLIDGTDDFVATALSELTGGLLDISTGSVSEFDIGPIADFGGKIDSILDKFNLNFTSFIEEFKLDFTSFDENLADAINDAQRELIDFKPRSSFGRLGSLLQIGSRDPSPQFSLQLKENIWLKLDATFPSYTYHGVPVPGLPVGLSFQEAFPQPSDLQVRDLLPAIAVAYGKASSFSDKRATHFSIDDLFTPEFGPGLSSRLLDKLKNFADAPDFASIFGRFDGIDPVSGLPMDLAKKEIFDVTLYLPEIQVAFQLAPSVDLTAKGFSANDIQNALFPSPVPSVKSFTSFIKRKIIPQIRNALDFDVNVSPRTTGGLTLNTPTLGENGFDFGAFSDTSTQLFPPSVDISDVEGFDFDLQLETSSDSIFLQVDFLLNVQGVDPLLAIQDAADSLTQMLQSVGGDFDEIADGFVENLSSAGFLGEITSSERLTVELDAKIDVSVSVELNFGSSSVSVESELRELSTALSVRIQDNFITSFGDFDFEIDAELQLLLSADNSAVPFDLFADVSKLSDFSFGGSLDTRSVVEVSDIPAAITFEASLPDLTNASSLQFGVFVDINLRPIREKIAGLLGDIDKISLPQDVEEYVSFLPSIDVSCISTSGQEFLNQPESFLPVSDFFDAIAEGCSGGPLKLTGGYNTTKSELAMNVVIEVGTTRSAREVVKALEDILPFSIDRSFYEALSDLDISVGGNLLLDFSIGVTGLDRDLIGTDDYAVNNEALFFEINAFTLSAEVSSQDINLDFPLLQSQAESLAFNLVDGSFLVDFSIYLDSATSLTELFGDNPTSELVFEGAIDIVLPVEAEVSGAAFALTVTVNDDDIFDDSGLAIEYEYNLCEIKTQIESLLDGLVVEVVTTFQENLQLNGLGFDVDKLTDPIVERAGEVLGNLTQKVLDGIDDDCDTQRMLQETASPSSLAEKIDDALQQIRDELEELGIELVFSATPSFDSATFVASLDVSLNITVGLLGSDALDIVERFLGDATGAGNVDDLGLSGQESDSSPLTIDTSQLLDNTVISAGFDISFGIQLDIKAIQEGGVSNLIGGIQEGLAVQISSWGAYALLAVDPIELELSFDNTTLTVRDSSFALSANIRSSGSFSATVKEIVDGSTNTSGLVPDVTIPLNVELIFDLDIADVTLSPILSLSVDNVIDVEDLLDGFSADLDLEAFLADGGAFGGEGKSLDHILDTATTLLQDISSYGPELNLAETPAIVGDLFSIINQASDFSGALAEFLSIAGDVQDKIPTELRSFVRQINQFSINGGCINPTTTFTNYTFDLLVSEGLLTGEEANLETYLPCDHLGKIQNAFGLTDAVEEVSDLQSFVVLGVDLTTRIENIFGLEFDTQEIVSLFESKSLLRLVSFLSEFFAPAEDSEDDDSARLRRRLSSSKIPITTTSSASTKHRKRLDLFRDIRGHKTKQIAGRRHLEETAIASFDIGDYLQISVGYDFGDGGTKEIALTAKFSFATNDE